MIKKGERSIRKEERRVSGAFEKRENAGSKNPRGGVDGTASASPLTTETKKECD